MAVGSMWGWEAKAREGRAAVIAARYTGPEFVCRLVLPAGSTAGGLAAAGRSAGPRHSITSHHIAAAGRIVGATAVGTRRIGAKLLIMTADATAWALPEKWAEGATDEKGEPLSKK